MQFRRKARQPVDVGLIPMIDVLLVLLFFFMVATTFKQNSNLQINLPQAGNGQLQTRIRAVNLYIDGKGQYVLNAADDKPQPLAAQTQAALQAALAQLAAADRQLPLVIHADALTPHQFVIAALEAAGAQGFAQITFAVNPRESR